MAFENILSTVPGLTASADLKTSQYLFVKVDGEKTAGLAGAGEAVTGVLQNKPDLGQAATVANGPSTVRVVAGAAIVAGADVTPDANGKAVTAGAGDYIAGTCITATSALDELATVDLSQPGRSA